jgi:hypothetical protein
MEVAGPRLVVQKLIWGAPERWTVYRVLGDEDADGARMSVLDERKARMMNRALLVIIRRDPTPRAVGAGRVNVKG